MFCKKSKPQVQPIPEGQLATGEGPSSSVSRFKGFAIIQEEAALF